MSPSDYTPRLNTLPVQTTGLPFKTNGCFKSVGHVVAESSWRTLWRNGWLFCGFHQRQVTYPNLTVRKVTYVTRRSENNSFCLKCWLFARLLIIIVSLFFLLIFCHTVLSVIGVAFIFNLNGYSQDSFSYFCVYLGNPAMLASRLVNFNKPYFLLQFLLVFSCEIDDSFEHLDVPTSLSFRPFSKSAM